MARIRGGTVMSYTIIYEQEANDAKSPLEAVKWTLDGIMNGEALMFTVTDNKTGKQYSVDLQEEDEDAVIPMQE